MALRLRDFLVLWSVMVATVFAVAHYIIRYGSPVYEIPQPITLEEVEDEYSETDY